MALRLERDTPLCIIAFSVSYWLFTALHSMARLWYDELKTFYISRLPSADMIWTALKDGPDFNPPLLYWVTRIAQRFFGESPMATRLPQMIGFWALCLCLFCFVSRRCGRLYGLCAMVFPVLTIAYGYASNARAYGIVLGFCGIALVCWQMATEKSKRSFWLLAYSLALAGALATHVYACLLVIPFGMGELARAWRTRKADYPAWIATALPLLSLAVYIPLIPAFRSFTMKGSIFRPDASSISKCYTFLLGPAAWVLVAALCIGISLSRYSAARNSQAEDHPIGPRFHEIVCAVGLALVPVFGVLFALATTGIFLERYGLAGVIGAGVLLVSFVGWSSHYSPIAAACVFLLFGGWFLWTSGVWACEAVSGYTPSSRLPALELSQLRSDLPIVLSSGLMFLEADHYESKDVLSRTYYLLNRPAALAYTGTDVFEQDFQRARRWFPLRGQLVNYDTFRAAHSTFLVFGPYAYANDWLIRKLADDGSTFVLKGEYRGPYGDCVLLEVTCPRPPLKADAHKH
jgi:4-amino-4-deoxy-L-arabinose transferase-like glycosyltransferase